MLYLTNDPNAVGNIVDYVSDRFNMVYTGKNLLNPLYKNIVKDVDKSDIISENLVVSPILGEISPMFLSTGVKNCYIMMFDLDLNNREAIDLNYMGDNVLKWLSEIYKFLSHDVYVYTEVLRELPYNIFDEIDIGFIDIEGKITKIKNNNEYLAVWATL